MRITVEGRSYEVEVEMLDDDTKGTVSASRRVSVPISSREDPSGEPPPRAPSVDAGPAGDGKLVKSPIAGTVQSVAVKVGDRVSLNDTLLVLEAMKMESAVASPIEGVVKAVHAEAGKAVRMADVLVEFE